MLLSKYKKQNQTNKNFLLVQTEGFRLVKRNIDHFVLAISNLSDI